MTGAERHNALRVGTNEPLHAKKLCNTAAIVIIIMDLYNVIIVIMHTSKILSFSHCFRAMLAVDKSVYSYGLCALINRECKVHYRHFPTYAVVPEASVQVRFQNTYGQPVV